MKFSERQIAAWLARNTFNRNCLLLVPNCIWTGHECDLLAITKNLRIIDIEIKITRSDLRADTKKEKWYWNWDWKIDGPWTGNYEARRRRDWPRKVWKHYYCMPLEIWKPELLPAIPAQSGVLLITEIDRRTGPELRVRCERMAHACRDAEPISAESAIDIARLASLRMWNAYDSLDSYVKGLAP